jgi:hypothetical protein
MGRSGVSTQNGGTVTALYSDSALSFPLTAEATLEEVAERLAALGEGHGGMPLYVGVTFRPSRLSS